MKHLLSTLSVVICLAGAEKNVKFYLQKNDRNPEIVLLIHGWIETPDVKYFSDLKKLGSNGSVVEVDWSKIAALDYFTSASSVKKVGKITADFILNMNSSLSNFHLIGHSLGAHIAGLAGQHVFYKTGQKLGRITGLDPAQPLFYLFPEEDRLSEDDAQIVFVIHTDGGVFGYLSPCGTIDVFVNGGVRKQPGCPFQHQGNPIFCSHQRSFAVYVDALKNPGTLIGTQCQDYFQFTTGICNSNKKIDLGGKFSKEDEGMYYLKTGGIPPYGIKINTQMQ